MLPIRSVVAAKYGKDFDLLDNPQTALEQRRRVCEIVLDLNDGIFALPVDQGASVFRYAATQLQGGSLIIK